MTQSVVQSYIEKLKTHFRVSSDDELARELDVGKSTIATWRRRGTIPREIWAEKLIDEIDYIPVVYDHIARELSFSDLGQRILLNASMQFACEINAPEIASWANWIVDHKYWIFLEVAKRGTNDQSDMRIDDAYISSTMVSFAIRLAGSNLLTPALLKKVRTDMAN